MKLINDLGTSWIKLVKEEKTNLIMLSIYDHLIIKNNFFLLINWVAKSYIIWKL